MPGHSISNLIAPMCNATTNRNLLERQCLKIQMSSEEFEMFVLSGVFILFWGHFLSLFCSVM